MPPTNDPTSNDALTAALEGYNEAARQTQVAEQKLNDLQGSARPPDSALGHDAGGKQYDLDFQQAKNALSAAQTQAATASRQVATIMQAQAAQTERENTPTALANADRARAMADYYTQQANGYAARATNDTTRANAAQTAAAAALQRADVAASRADAQNNASNAQANNANANAASTAARTPAEIAQAEAAAANSRASAANTTARTPGEIALTGAQTGEAQARQHLVELQIQQLNENSPLVRAQLQAQIDNLQSEIATRGKPSLEPGFQNALDIPSYQFNPDTKQYELKWVPNHLPMTPYDAIKQLAAQMGANLGDGPGQIPLDQAKSLISMAHDTYTAQTERQQANNQGAQVGAGLLQNRVTAGTGMVNNILNGAASNPNFGRGSGLSAGWGGQMLQGAQDYTTQLGGGQQVYDTAAALVAKANPQLAGNPDVVGPLAVMLQQHQQATGQDHPAVASVQQDMGPGRHPGGGDIPGGGGGMPSFTSPTSAPTTTIAPDGTVTVQHVQAMSDPYANSASANPMPSFRAPTGMSGRTI